MTRFVALLRGINVGGVKLTNTQLVAAFEKGGFTNVKAVLASGNVVFDNFALNVSDQGTLALRLEEMLGLTFHYEAKLVLEPQENLRRIVEQYPFERSDKVQHPYVVFSSSADALRTFLDASIALPSDEESIAEGEGVVYWRVPRGLSLDSPFAKVLARRQFATSLTTRNLRTAEKLVNL